MTADTLRAQQLALEDYSMEEGIHRYRNEVQKAAQRTQESELAPQKHLLVLAMKPMVVILEQFKTDILGKGKAGRKGATAKLLADIDNEVAAFITAKVALNGISTRRTMGQVALQVGQYLDDHQFFEDFKKHDSKFYNRAKRKLKKSTTERHTRAAMSGYAARAGVVRQGWSKETKLVIGDVLIHKFCESTGLAEIYEERRGKMTTGYIRSTPKTTEYLKRGHQACEVLHPFHMPMVVRPEQWTTPRNGGYITHRMPLLKTLSKPYLEEVSHLTMPAVYNAINAVQETGFRINERMLNTLRDLWDTKSPLGKLPSRDDVDLPPLPEGCASVDEDEQELRVKRYKLACPTGWMLFKKHRKLAREENRRRVSKRLAIHQKLSMAEKMLPYEQFYFPHQLDWRGRMYCTVPFLNPQGDDTSKALLEFSTGKVIGARGIEWLKVHIANCFGVDKVSFAERRAWVDEHESHIRLCAIDPFTYKFWSDADAPFQFLAACFEYDHIITEGGESATTYLPVSLDGSCNGLQHLSAMLADEVGGTATNLVPSDKPADIYSEVAAVTNRKLTERVANGCQLSGVWLAGKVNRKLVKRNVMTIAYGATARGMLDQLRDEMFKQHGDAVAEWLGVGDDDVWPYIMHLGSLVRESIAEVVVAATQVMAWMQNLAGIAASNNLPLRWTTPAGLVIQQAYRKTKPYRVDTIIGGIRVQRQLHEETLILDAQRQVLGVAPNVTHSLDASHLMACVNACLLSNVTSFAMVHDSYGTHACDCDALADSIRNTFVDQYSVDVLGNFRDEIVKQLPEDKASEVPPLPPRGTLELAGVRKSEYFFA